MMMKNGMMVDMNGKIGKWGKFMTEQKEGTDQKEDMIKKD
jgi:hypothetical protein